MTRFYKFRAINDPAALDREHFLDALFKSYAVFSGRKAFNDPFDSKIDLVRPTPQELLSLLREPHIDPQKSDIMNSWIANAAFTPTGLSALQKLDVDLAAMVDGYPIYSTSSHNSCILLWAHYASCHTGFCIEFEFNGDQPQKISYRDHIESIPILHLLRYNLGLDDGRELEARIRNSLLGKLNCWSYEGEYRWIASNAMGRIPEGQARIKIKYDPSWVKAVIFGCRMPPAVKSYMLKGIPFTKFQQAIEMRDSIEIVDFDEKAHL